MQDSQKALDQDLPDEFARLRAALKPFVGGNLARVVFVSYANPAMQSEDKPCPGGRDGLDVHPAFSADAERLRATVEFVNKKFLPVLKALATCDGNKVCRDPMTDRMTFVDSHQAAFTRHGMCVHGPDDPEFDRECFSTSGNSFVTDLVAAAEDPMACSHPASNYLPYAPRARWIRSANDSYFTAMTYPEGIPATLKPSDIHDALWGVAQRRLRRRRASDCRRLRRDGRRGAACRARGARVAATTGGQRGATAAARRGVRACAFTPLARADRRTVIAAWPVERMRSIRGRPEASIRAKFGLDLGYPGRRSAPSGLRACPGATPSFFCRLVEDVVYWNTSLLSG